MAKRVLEVALNGLGVRYDGDRHAGQVGDNVLVAQLLFSRTLVSDVLVSSREIALTPDQKDKHAQSARLEDRTLGERLLFKKWVEGPVVGLKLEVTDRNSGNKVAQFLLDAVSGLVGAGSSALKSYATFVPLSGAAIDSVVSFARNRIVIQGEQAGQERILSLGEAHLDIPVDKPLAPARIHAWTSVTANLIASRDFNRVVYKRVRNPIAGKPVWQTAVDKKTVIKKGQTNGWVKIAYRVYTER